MTWKIDDIDFKDFGVRVSKSSGVLDLPELVDVSNDWAYLNGRDYWQDPADLKYQDREIALTCFIKAIGYADYKAKVAAFYAALTSPAEKVLSTPFGNTIAVTVQQPIQMARKTSYLHSQQTGKFTLRLTVTGDSLTKLITVYRQDGVVQGIVKYGSDAKISRSLQSSSDISFSAEFNSIQTLGRGDYIMYEGEKYVSLEYPQIDKFSTNKFVYRLTYTHEFFFLKDIQFRVIDRSDTPWWSNMADIMDMIVTNANRGHAGKFVKGTIDATENRNHQFKDESCFDVLSRVSSEYELEWEYKQNSITGVITINVKKQIGTATASTFEYGKDNLAYKINRVSTGRELLVTRLYAYGSDRNIPATYGYPRLKLPVEPLTREFFGMHVEKTKVFDDILPERTGTVSGYLEKTKAPTWVYAPGTFPGLRPVKIYTFYPDDNTYELTDSGMDFDLKELLPDGVSTKYLLPGTTAKIHFNSGDLAGFEFEVLDYDHTTKTFKLIPYTDEQGGKYPTALLKPALGDSYKILDIKIPQAYIDSAVARLQIAADAYIDEFYNPKPTYAVDTNPALDASYFPGDTVILVDTAFGINATMRITEFTKNIYLRTATVTLAWFVSKSKRQELTDKVGAIERALVDAKIDQVETRRASEVTTGEVKNMLIDPTDEKFRADEVVRRKTIDPVMLAEDAKTLQYSIKGALVTPNVGDDPNEMTIAAGEFLNHSFYAVDRKTIQIIADI